MRWSYGSVAEREPADSSIESGLFFLGPLKRTFVLRKMTVAPVAVLDELTALAVLIFALGCPVDVPADGGAVDFFLTRRFTTWRESGHIL